MRRPISLSLPSGESALLASVSNEFCRNYIPHELGSCVQTDVENSEIMKRNICLVYQRKREVVTKYKHIYLR